MSRIRPNIEAMAGYVPGEQINDPSVVKLNTNENPYPPSPRVFEAIRAALTGDRLRKYPEPLGDTFRKAAGEVLGIDPDGILIGNGSDDVLTILTRTFVPEAGTIAALTPSYLLYRSLAQIQGAKFAEIPWGEDWQLPEAKVFAKADIVFLPNPNSPSGTSVRIEKLAAFAAKLPGLFVLDEAYAEFAEADGVPLLKSVPNLVITRTMSKYYALAGIRFGFAMTTPERARDLNKVKDSYNCDALSLTAATAAIRDQPYYAELRSKIVASRGRLKIGLSELGFRVIPSQANFVWCRHAEKPSKPIYDALKARKILIRYMNYPTDEGLRITVGTGEEIGKLLSELRRIV